MKAVAYKKITGLEPNDHNGFGTAYVYTWALAIVERVNGPRAEDTTVWLRAGGPWLQVDEIEFPAGKRNLNRHIKDNDIELLPNF